MAEMATKDARTTAAGNLAFLARLRGLNCTTANKKQVKALLPVEVDPAKESLRLGFLRYPLTGKKMQY